MPVVLVFTKFDLLVSQVLIDIAGGDTQHHERAKARAQEMCEGSCRRLLRKHPRDVPAEFVSSTCSPVYVTWKGSLTPSVVHSEAEI